MSSPSVYISVLNWNGLSDTMACLESLFQLDYDNFQVLVVDNHSSDNSVAVLKEKYPSLQILENDENLGFTGGNNVAIEHALERQADYIWLLNNDTVVESDSLRELVQAGESDDKTGMLSSVIYYHADPRRKQFAGCRMDWSELSIDYPDVGGPIPERYTGGSEVCLWGTALLIKAGLLRKIGPLKAQYFAYWEDVEISLRAAKAGYLNKVCASSIVYHKTPISPTRKSKHYHYYMTRNRLLMLEEYLCINSRLVFYYQEFARLVAALGNLNRQGGAEFTEPAVHGFFDAYRGVTGPMSAEDFSALDSLLSILTRRHPYLVSNLLRGRFGTVLRQMLDRVFSKPAIENSEAA